MLENLKLLNTPLIYLLSLKPSPQNIFSAGLQLNSDSLHSLAVLFEVALLSMLLLSLNNKYIMNH